MPRHFDHAKVGQLVLDVKEGVTASAEAGRSRGQHAQGFPERVFGLSCLAPLSRLFRRFRLLVLLAPGAAGTDFVAPLPNNASRRRPSCPRFPCCCYCCCLCFCCCCCCFSILSAAIVFSGSRHAEECPPISPPTAAAAAATATPDTAKADAAAEMSRSNCPSRGSLVSRPRCPRCWSQHGGGEQKRRPTWAACLAVLLLLRGGGRGHVRHPLPNDAAGCPCCCCCCCCSCQARPLPALSASHPPRQRKGQHRLLVRAVCIKQPRETDATFNQRQTRMFWGLRLPIAGPGAGAWSVSQACHMYQVWAVVLRLTVLSHMMMDGNIQKLKSLPYMLYCCTQWSWTLP